MKSRNPILVAFEPGDSLLSPIETSFAIYAKGRINLPLVPLDFSKNNINANGFDPDPYLGNDGEVDNKKFFEKYDDLPLAFKKHFWGATGYNNKTVDGAQIDISFGKLAKIKDSIDVPEKISNNVGKKVVKYLQRYYMDFENNFSVQKKISEFISSKILGLLDIKSGTSTNSIMHGINNNDTYNLDIIEFYDAEGMFIIELGAGVIASISGAIVFLSKNSYSYTVGAVTSIIGIPMLLKEVFEKSIGLAFIPTANVGVIPPAMQITLLSSSLTSK